jgi:ABC-type amino acid transport substrate-binding protein
MKIKRYKIRTSWLRAIVFLTLQLAFLNPQLSVLSAKDFYGYTKDRPLVIVSDWDFQPYEFLNNDGEPAGYNIDVLNLILDKLDIPHNL